MERIILTGIMALAIAVGAFTGTARAWTEADRRLTRDEALADLAIARDALESIHPGYDRYVSRASLDGSWQALETDIQSGDGLVVSDLYLRLSRLLTDIRCDHTKAEIPRDLEEARKTTPSFFPFRFFVAGNRAAIVSAADEANGLLRGDEIVSINGRSIAALLDEIRPLIAVDGDTLHAREPALEATGEYLGSAFEHFYALRYGVWDTAQITVRRGTADTLTVAVKPITFTDWRAMPWPGLAYRPNFKDAVSLNTRAAPGVAILQVDTFVNYRSPVDPRTVYGPLFERLAADKVKVLIIDTRLNGGGSTDAMLALLAHVSEQPFRFLRSRYVKTLDLARFSKVINTWDPSLLTPDPDRFILERPNWYREKPAAGDYDFRLIDPLKPTFGGHVIALSNAQNASGVTMMLGRLKALRPVDIIGEPTGGSVEGPTAGTLFFVKLPTSGIIVRVPFYRQYLDVPSFEPRLGVMPDIPVTVTLEDRLADRDPVLDAALARAAEIMGSH